MSTPSLGADVASNCLTIRRVNGIFAGTGPITAACLVAIGVAAIGYIPLYIGDAAFKKPNGSIFREVATAVDQAAQTNDTLFVCGQTPSDYIQFASSYPRPTAFTVPGN